jgi:hypothetical protein
MGEICVFIGFVCPRNYQKLLSLRIIEVKQTNQESILHDNTTWLFTDVIRMVIEFLEREEVIIYGRSHDVLVVQKSAAEVAIVMWLLEPSISDW